MASPPGYFQRSVVVWLAPAGRPRPAALADAMPALFAVLRDFYQVELAPREGAGS